MALVRRIARPLLAAPFVFEGVRTALHPEREIDVFPQAFEAADKSLARVSQVPSFLDMRTIVRATGVVAAGAGLMYATNRCPRLAAVTLLATTSVGWAGRKRVWELRGEDLTGEVQSILTDAGLLGGVLLAAVDHDGKPSLGYRAEQFIERSQKKAAKTQRDLEKKAKGAVGNAQKQLAAQRG